MTYEVFPPSFDYGALEPHISKGTVTVHYEKHHNGYLTKLNNAVEGDSKYENMNLEDLIKKADGDVFNNAAQVWNHSFYWNSLKPDGGGSPSGEFLEAIKHDYGTVNSFEKEFSEAAKKQFGSGWAWLVKTKKGLEIVTTSNAENPLRKDQIPLFTLDVWEHAYYLDYQNLRDQYIEAFFKHLINWDFAAENFSQSHS